jgi:hypothetical protein
VVTLKIFVVNQSGEIVIDGTVKVLMPKDEREIT